MPISQIKEHCIVGFSMGIGIGLGLYIMESIVGALY